MTSRQKKIAVNVIGFLISAVLLVFIFYRVDFAELADALKGANYYWLIPNVVLIMVTMVFRAYRWKYMVLPIRDIGIPRLFSITMIGFMANNVLPFRLGEFVRAYSLSSKEHVSKSAALATIFVERLVFDLLALLSIFGVVFLISPMEISDELRIGIIVTVSTGLIGMLIAIYLSARQQRDSHVMKLFRWILPEKLYLVVEGTVSRFATGLEFLRSGRGLFWVSFHTIMIWVVMGLSNYFIFLVFGLDLPITASFVLLVVVSVLIIAPSTPGFVGVYHYGVYVSLSFYGVPKSTAVSCALVMHATQFLVITLIGLYYLRREHLSLRAIEEGAEEIEAKEV